MISTASPKAGPGVPNTTDPPTSSANTSKLVHVSAAAVPVIWIVAALLYPQDQTTANNGTWLVHIAQLALAPLLGIVIWLLLRPLQGTAASVGRVAIVLWIALFSAFDAIAGIATGVLLDGGLQGASTYLFEHQTFGGEFSVLGSVAHPMWIVVAISCALALRMSRARSSAWVAMLALSLVRPSRGSIRGSWACCSRVRHMVRNDAGGMAQQRTETRLGRESPRFSGGLSLTDFLADRAFPVCPSMSRSQSMAVSEPPPNPGRFSHEVRPRLGDAIGNRESQS
jgi:hypothetical protein